MGVIKDGGGLGSQSGWMSTETEFVWVSVDFDDDTWWLMIVIDDDYWKCCWWWLMDVNGIVAGVFFQRTWRWLWLQMPWHGRLSSVEIQIKVCNTMSMACHAVSKSLRIRKESKDSKKVSMCKMQRLQDHNSWGRFFSSTRVTSIEMPRNSQTNLPIYGIPTFELTFIHQRKHPPNSHRTLGLLPWKPAFQTRRVSPRETLRRFLRYCPWPPFPCGWRSRLRGFTLDRDRWTDGWWINGRDALHPWENSHDMAGTWKIT